MGLYIGIGIFVILWIISGFLSLDLHKMKGYDGGFFLGFLLGIIGLIYSAGLPDRAQKEIVKDNKTNKIKVVVKDEEISQEEDNDDNYILCKKCGFPIYEDETKCSNCGEFKTIKK